MFRWRMIETAHRLSQASLSEWAAIIQAVGSVAAILFAWFLSGAAHRRELRARMRARKTAARAILNECRSTLKRLDDDCQAGRLAPDMMESFADETQSEITHICGLSLQDIDDKELIAGILRAHRLMASTNRKVKLVILEMNGGMKPNSKYFERLRHSIDDIFP